MTTRVRHIVGCMTGTSIDGLDAALIRVEGTGLAMHARVLACSGCDFASLGVNAAALRALAQQQPMPAHTIAALSRDLSLAHAHATQRLLDQHPGVTIDLIAVHGQTVYHAPPVSWQLFNPWPLAQHFGVPVVFDLRGADIAAGGQGAPITPIADWVLFRADHARAIVNLGGFCNITHLPAHAENCSDLSLIRGHDLCACNQLLDALARSLLNTPFDAGGSAACAGEVHTRALEDLEGVLSCQSQSRRSLGTGDESTEWVSRWRAHVSPNDLAATACEGVGHAIARATQSSNELLLAGGGVHNRALVSAITGWASSRVRTLDDVGVPASAREAAEMGVLGALCQDRVPITLPGVTGVPAAPIAGCWACSY